MNDFMVGRLIKEMRKERDITMVDFAKRIKTSQPSLSRVENGTQELSFTLLTKICEEFGISMSEFFLRLEGKIEFHKIPLTSAEGANDIGEELDIKLNSMISSLTFEQKKGLYVLLLPFIK